jgi:iron only hydrogenase large subunit-like protein
MFTSCCPGWVGYVEDEAADLIPHLSTCKSPHMMVGAMVKRFFAQKIGRNASDIVMSSIMPCYKKQWEADRIDMQTPDGAREVDHVVTTKQLGAWLQREGIDYPKLGK